MCRASETRPTVGRGCAPGSGAGCGGRPPGWCGCTPPGPGRLQGDPADCWPPGCLHPVQGRGRPWPGPRKRPGPPWSSPRTGSGSPWRPWSSQSLRACSTRRRAMRPGRPSGVIRAPKTQAVREDSLFIRGLTVQ